MRTEAVLICLAVTAAHAGGTLQLPEIFTSGMVLQKSAQTPVWGTSEPGSKVLVTLGKTTAETQAENDGKWRVNFDLESVGPGPHEMKVNELTLSDVLVGEVWLCGGQSNMQQTLGGTLDSWAVINASANPNLRQFFVPRRTEDDPADDIRGKWTQAGPSDGGKFSAVGYYFARELQHELGVPVGIINASWGSSPAEAWMSREGLSQVKSVTAAAAAGDEEARTYPARREEFMKAFQAWMTENDLKDDRAWTVAEVMALLQDRWSAVTLPPTAPPTAEPGTIWLRRTVDIPAAAAGKPLPITLGTVNMLEDVWWNGEFVAGTTLEKYETGRNPRKPEVPGQLVREGPNELLLRIWSPSATPHFLVWADSFNAGPVSLKGPWQMVRETSNALTKQAPPTPPRELIPVQQIPYRPFNGMIAPLVPYGIAGIIWYQGENNSARSQEYLDVFPALIKDWRRLWNRADLPFFWCQLSAHKKKNASPIESEWAELQEAQTKTLALPNTGQAVTYDIGEAGDIHPRNKAVPGKRLADIALSKVYQRSRPLTGPVFGGATFEQAKAIISFADTAGGLVASPVPDTHLIKSIPLETAPLTRNSPNSELEGFAICGPDRVWSWADAKIDGDKVIVWSPNVADPTAVRFAWADNPTVNLRGKNGLPAVPFRTDNFPLITAGKSLP